LDKGGASTPIAPSLVATLDMGAEAQYSFLFFDGVKIEKTLI